MFRVPKLKYRRFDLQNRLGDHSHIQRENDERFNFKSRNSRKVKSIWWSVATFLGLLYFMYYLKNI